MDYIEIIYSLVTALLGGGIGVLVTLRAARRKADAEALQAQAQAQKELESIWGARLDQLREEVDYERQRNIDLDAQHRKEIDYERERNRELITRNIDKENRFQEQTLLLRKHVAEVIELTKKNGELETELACVRCEDRECPFRRPPNAYTPPHPGINRDEWHKSKEKAI